MQGNTSHEAEIEGAHEVREILERCVELDRTAYETYKSLSEVCDDADLRGVFDKLATEELQHVEWWTELLEAWESGLVPDIAGEHELVAELDMVKRYVDESIAVGFDELCGDDMLDMAAHLEFYMLNPLFGELADIMGPGSHVDRREAYSRHVMRLVNAIQKHHTDKGPASFLARMLLRSYKDQQRYIALSMEDQLTGLHNRRGILAHLDQWLAWSARYVRPVSIVLLDVDRFKEVNDNHGHVVGDEVLRLVAEALREAARSSDMVGRFGGDEFMVLAPETTGAELTQLMERLHERISAIPQPVMGKDVPVTVSLGGAWLGGGASIDAVTVIAAADRSLYDAKEGGRDRSGAPRQVFAPVI